MGATCSHDALDLGGSQIGAGLLAGHAGGTPQALGVPRGDAKLPCSPHGPVHAQGVGEPC